MTCSPTVTVAMPVHRARVDYLDAAIRSVLAQTWEDFELLIVDDGSADPQLEDRLRDWTYADPRVRIFPQPRRGLTSALNFLLMQARGRFFARMDADDISLSARLEVQVAWLTEHPEVVLASCWFELIDGAGVPLRKVRTVTDHEAILRAFGRRQNPIAHPGVMLRTEAASAVGGYDERFGVSGGSEDFELWTRLAAVGRLAIIPDVLLQYRLTLESVSHANAEAQFWQHWLAWKTWQLRRRGVKDAYERAAAMLDRWTPYYRRAFRAEALRQQASRLRLLGLRARARHLLVQAWMATPWNPTYLGLWAASFVR